MQRGFEIAREEINNLGQLGDAKITFITEDDQGTVEDAVEAYNKLIHQDGVSVILGPANSSQVRETFPIAQQNRVVAISSLSSASGLSAIGDFNFRISLTTDVLVPSGIRITQEKLGYTKVATIYDEVDLYSTDSNKVVREALTANSVEILTTETYQTGETDFSAQLTRIKETNPDAIFISALAPEMIEIMIQARQLGIPTSVPFIVPDLTGDEVAAVGDAAQLLLPVGAAPLTHREIKPSSRTTNRNTGRSQTRGRRSRMQPFISWLKRLPTLNPPMQPQFGTHWQISKISTPFWGSSLLTLSGTRFTT